jgi:hypothetical protein
MAPNCMAWLLPAVSTDETDDFAEVLELLECVRDSLQDCNWDRIILSSDSMPEFPEPCKVDLDKLPSLMTRDIGNRRLRVAVDAGGKPRIALETTDKGRLTMHIKKDCWIAPLPVFKDPQCVFVPLCVDKVYHTSDAAGYLGVCFEYVCCCTHVLGVVVGITICFGYAAIHVIVGLCNHHLCC